MHGQNIERSADFSGLSSAWKADENFRKGSAYAPNKGETELSLVEAFLFSRSFLVCRILSARFRDRPFDNT